MKQQNSRPEKTISTYKRPWVCLLAVLLVIAALPAAAQDIEDMPGFVDFRTFSGLNVEDLTVEINLGGALLNMLSSAVEEEDGEFSQLLHGLSLIKVNIFKTPDSDAANLQLRTAVRKLRADGWEAVVSIRDEENLHILLRTEGDTILGLLAAFSDDESFGMVNIVGSFDPEQIGRLARQLNIDPLEDFDLSGGDDNE